jgi:hypothetical protein
VTPRATLEAYDAVVRVTQNKRRPIYRTRYVVRCECGWSIAGCDYITARRLFREHTTQYVHAREGLGRETE